MALADFRDGLISINAAAKQLRIHVSTIHRWANSGVRNKRLQTRLVGGRRYIEASELMRFLEAEAPVVNCCPDDARRQRAQDLLDSFGITRNSGKKPPSKRSI